MKFCKEFKAIFSDEELIFIAKEATLVYENDNNEIDYLLWLRVGKHYAEIRMDYGTNPRIRRLDESENEYYEKDELLELLRNSKPSELKYIEVE